MRYFALLYAPVEQREALAALFAVEAEMRATVRSAHEVAHARSAWWRTEIDRLINSNAQHPVTRALQSALPEGDFSALHDLLAAADMDIVRMTYNTRNELNAYLDRSGGKLFELMAALDSRASVRSVGQLIRRVETLRDLVVDVRAGNIYWPLDELAVNGIEPERIIDPEHRAKLLSLLTIEARRISMALAKVDLPSSLAIARPMAVLAALHGKVAKRIASNPEIVFQQRIELGAIEKVWTAWRAARRS